jgi:hypothetical protein
VYLARAAAARARLSAFAAVAAGCALSAAWVGPAYVRLALLVPLVLCTLAGALALLDREKTAAGELLGAAALSSFSVPVLAVANVAVLPIASFALGWLLVHTMATLTARAYVYRKRGGGRWLRVWALGSIVVLAVCALSYALELLPWSFCLAPLPFVVAAAALATGSFTPRTPKVLGWTLAAANVWALLFFGLSARSMI